MSSGERPIGAAKGKQSDTEALCHPPPPPALATFLKRPFPTDFKKYTHAPPKGTKLLRIGTKVHKTQENCQNPPCWRVPNVPERYDEQGTTGLGLGLGLGLDQKKIVLLALKYGSLGPFWSDPFVFLAVILYESSRDAVLELGCGDA